MPVVGLFVYAFLEGTQTALTCQTYRWQVNRILRTCRKIFPIVPCLSCLIISIKFCIHDQLTKITLSPSHRRALNFPFNFVVIHHYLNQQCQQFVRNTSSLITL